MFSKVFDACIRFYKPLWIGHLSSGIFHLFSSFPIRNTCLGCFVGFSMLVFGYQLGASLF